MSLSPVAVGVGGVAERLIAPACKARRASPFGAPWVRIPPPERLSRSLRRRDSRGTTFRPALVHGANSVSMRRWPRNGQRAPLLPV